MSDAQKRVPRGRRRLRRIDRELRRSDPELASMLSIFSRLNAGEMMPGWEQVRTSPVLDWHLPLWPLASVAFLIVFAAGGGSGAARGAAVACGARRTARPAGASGLSAAPRLPTGCCLGRSRRRV
jgi:hypothetical protein